MFEMVVSTIRHMPGPFSDKVNLVAERTQGVILFELRVDGDRHLQRIAALAYPTGGLGLMALDKPGHAVIFHFFDDLTQPLVRWNLLTMAEQASADCLGATLLLVEALRCLANPADKHAACSGRCRSAKIDKLSRSAQTARPRCRRDLEYHTVFAWDAIWVLLQTGKALPDRRCSRIKAVLIKTVSNGESSVRTGRRLAGGVVSKLTSWTPTIAAARVRGIGVAARLAAKAQRCWRVRHRLRESATRYSTHPPGRLSSWQLQAPSLARFRLSAPVRACVA
ncbi:MAG: hypothetical protein EOS78_06060 [Mesorhizobium sp.]|nr:MAG: hypothetical protein EOS78_06060 [Mesorhizobium sp.]